MTSLPLMQRFAVSFRDSVNTPPLSVYSPVSEVKEYSINMSRVKFKHSHKTSMYRWRPQPFFFPFFFPPSPSPSCYYNGWIACLWFKRSVSQSTEARGLGSVRGTLNFWRTRKRPILTSQTSARRRPSSLLLEEGLPHASGTLSSQDILVRPLPASLDQG